MKVRAAIAERPPTIRSRITNGRKVLENVDGRTAEARRYRDLVISFADDLGGIDKLTEAEKALCRQAAASVIAAERVQSVILAGRDVDLDTLMKLTNVTTRLLTRLKARHKPRRAPSPLTDHFAQPPAREAR